MAQAILARISGPTTSLSLALCSSFPVDGPPSIASGASALVLTVGGRRRSSSCTSNAVDRTQFDGWRIASNGKRRALRGAAVPDIHSFTSLVDWVNSHPSPPDLHSVPFFADLLNMRDWINPDWFAPQLDESEFTLGLKLAPERVMDDQKSNWELSIDQMKHFYMAASLVFAWGCCVFGSMNDEFYDSDLYRNDGGNGTGHWIYDKEERDAEAARAEMWSEELASQIEATQIEEKAEEGVRY